MTVMIAGAGIAGCTLALTCHQLGLPVRVFESVRKLQPLGVGINLQPNAVRELFELGLADVLESIGVQAEEWALFARNGKQVWSEPRGTAAGYNWPQYSVHRGRLQMALYQAVLDRLGPESVVTGAQLLSYRVDDSLVSADFRYADGTVRQETGKILIGADGIRSSVRSQMHPQEGPPRWNGAVMWRGTSRHAPVRTSNSFVLIGEMSQRFVCYPISATDPETGTATLNWIAELTLDRDGALWKDSDWNRRAGIDEFLPSFADWEFGWIDVAKIIRSAQEVFVYPMVDRDPVDSWVDGRVLLIGDAAHAMYPTGSNGASQAIVDARLLGARLIEHGLAPAALLAFEAQSLPDTNKLILRNRAAGPIGLLGVVEERCGGQFEHISDVLSPEEASEYMAAYKDAAGFARDTLNAAAPMIDPKHYS